MATIALDEQALKDADAFLTAYLVENIPDADFSQGSVVRDFVITAIAYIFAFLEKERKTTRDQQSLLALSTQVDDESVKDAVNALLSNWFLNRKTGLTARLTATLHFSSANDFPLAQTTRFYRTGSLVYVPDITSDTVIPASQLIPVFDANNVVKEYTTTVNLIAQQVGTAYNLPPGKFQKADQFSPYFTYAENTSSIQGGKDVESTTELLARAPTAISIRNLVNSRSIDTVLRETFSGITRVLSIGFGDPEMLRDFTRESVTRLRMHLGGHTDIYAQLPITAVVESGTIGAPYTRPDNVIAQFKDFSANFTTSGVVPGDVLNISLGLSDAPREYIIATVVDANTLTVNPRIAFSEATEENVPVTYVTYSIGNTAPNYSDKILVDTSGGITSRSIQAPGRIILKGRPHYRIARVEVYNVSAPGTIFVHTSRVNTFPGPLEYRVLGDVPAQAQSSLSLDQIEVDPAPYSVGTWIMRVTYDTLAGYDEVQAFVTDRFERVLASNPLVRGYTPVYISLSIGYRLKTGTTTALNEVAAGQTLASFINTFNLLNALDITAMLQTLRDAFPEIGVVVGIPSLTYNLYAPDGQVYAFRSDDIVTVYPTYQENSAHLSNGAALRVPILNADIDPTIGANEPLFAAANVLLKDQLLAMGVSDRTLIYVTSPDDITLTLVP